MKKFLFVLCLFPISVWAQVDVPLIRSDFKAAEFTARRNEIIRQIGSEGIAVLKGAPSPRGFTRFRQTNEFYYLSGIEVPHAILVMDGNTKQSFLFLPNRNEARERSEGKMLSAEDADWLRDTQEFDGVYSTDLFAEWLGRVARRGKPYTLWTPFQPGEGFAESRDMGLRVHADLYSDPWDGRPSAENRFISLLKERFPMFELRDLNPTMDEMRLIKSPAELELIKKSTFLSGLALMESMRSVQSGMKELELDAVAKFIFYREGAIGDAYYSLVASGHNAFFPHYNAGQRIMKDGDFLLMDYAPDYGYYMSDVTRMFPVNGKFSPWQRELYGFYLACYKAILKHIKPGQTASQVRAKAVVEMEALLEKTTFSKPEYEKGARNFVFTYRAGSFNAFTTLGHGVGMATHDVGSYNGPLKPGMVFTIEPALRVPEEMIYIRLEDMIVITETGADILSDFVPMEIEEIERLMAESGILQTYTRTTAGIKR
ncbi:MAG TPA: Xaa-Pro peptidase family protein [Rhodothermales bacterium]|nr:Xaa-Pro peptidase family protein [Rhodothermales bacterium]